MTARTAVIRNSFAILTTEYLVAVAQIQLFRLDYISFHFAAAFGCDSGAAVAANRYFPVRQNFTVSKRRDDRCQAKNLIIQVLHFSLPAFLLEPWVLLAWAPPWQTPWLLQHLLIAPSFVAVLLHLDPLRRLLHDSLEQFGVQIAG
jgi:hypothetical protein